MKATDQFLKTKVGSFRNAGRLGEHKYPLCGQVYYTGVVATEFGFVSVYADSRGYSFDFIWAGNEYSYGCQSNELPSELKLVRRAKKFAADVVRSACNELIESDRPQKTLKYSKLQGSR